MSLFKRDNKWKKYNMTHGFLLPNRFVSPPHSAVFGLIPFQDRLRIKRYNPIFHSTSATDSHHCTLNFTITTKPTISEILILSILLPGQQALCIAIHSKILSGTIFESPVCWHCFFSFSINLFSLLLSLPPSVSSTSFLCPSHADTLNSFASLFLHCICQTKPELWVNTAIHLFHSCTGAAELCWRNSQSLT